MYKIDLHTHSSASPDGGLNIKHYKNMLETGGLDYIAITDHNRIDVAQNVQHELGERIIVGEEIRACEGEIIGLYLKEVVPAGLSVQQTVAAIHAQKGLVCIPHPFEDVRQGISETALATITKDVDIIEIHNGRAMFQNKSGLAQQWQQKQQWPAVANSDAHGAAGWGRTYTRVAEPPTRATLLELLRHATYHVQWPGVRGVLYPKLNRMTKGFRHA